MLLRNLKPLLCFLIVLRLSSRSSKRSNLVRKLLSCFKIHQAVIITFLLSTAKERRPFRGLPYFGEPHSIHRLPVEEVIRLYRFSLEELQTLYYELRVPDFLTCDNGCVCPTFIAFLMMIRKFSFPIRLQCIAKEFMLEFSQVSRYIKVICRYIFLKYAKMLFWDNRRLNLGQLQEYARSFTRLGVPYTHLFGFIDGKICKICRPISNQRIYYSGHKRCHCLRFQNVTTPDGFISSFYGPLPGCFNDINILQESGLREILENSNSPYHLYGDAIYASQGTKFMTAFTPPENLIQEEINALLNSLRTEVEHSFAVISNQFSSYDFSRLQKVRLSPIFIEMPIMVLLANCMNTFRPNQISQKFDLRPCSLRHYLHGS
jgi:hypothetical protein